MQNEAIFEAPGAHEANGYSQEFENQEMHEFEYEDEANHYGNPEMHEFEWETHEANHYGNPEMHEYDDESEYEDESDRFLGGILGGLAKSFLGESSQEYEWETHEANHYGNPEMHEMEYEDESDRFLGGLLGGLAKSFLGESSHEYEDELSGEADPFFGKAFKAIKNVASKVAPVAKLLAPIAAKAAGSLIPIPGAGAIAGQLVSSMLKEGEMEATEFENHFTNLFANNEFLSEAGQHELAHEAALTELLAAEAAEAATEAEAEATLAAALPITITIMGARRPLRRIMPVLTQANGRLVKTLRQQGPAGRQLLRTVPAIQRRTVAGLKAASRRGQPITGPLAVQTMARATQRVLGNPYQVKRAVKRNLGMRVRTTPRNATRITVYAPNASRRSMPGAGFRRSVPMAPRRRTVY